MLKVKSIHLELEQTKVLNNCSIDVSQGETHILMGPNGSGKSSLAFVLAGHPAYNNTEGSINFNGHDLSGVTPDERSRRGIFLAFQYPQTIQGVSVGNFIKSAMQAHKIYDGAKFRSDLLSELKLHGLDQSFAARSVNDGFSGGEKKRLELVQMHMLKPKLAILDEIDSGLDVDGLKLVVKSIKRFMNNDRSVVVQSEASTNEPLRAIIVITHYPKLVKLLVPDRVHVMLKGSIVGSGGLELADKIDKVGYVFAESLASK